MGKGERTGNFTYRSANAEREKAANGQVRTQRGRTVVSGEIVETNNLLIRSGSD